MNESEIKKVLLTLGPDQIKEALDSLTEDQRVAIFKNYCVHCGDPNPKCKCSNDD